MMRRDQVLTFLQYKVFIFQYASASRLLIAHFGKEWWPGDEVAPQALMGLFGGTQVKTNMAELSAECHSMDCSGDSVVLTELEIAIRSKLLF